MRNHIEFCFIPIKLQIYMFCSSCHDASHQLPSCWYTRRHIEHATQLNQNHSSRHYFQCVFITSSLSRTCRWIACITDARLSGVGRVVYRMWFAIAASSERTVLDRVVWGWLVGCMFGGDATQVFTLKLHAWATMREAGRWKREAHTASTHIECTHSAGWMQFSAAALHFTFSRIRHICI